MSARLYSYVVLVIGAVTLTVGCVITQPGVVIAGGVLVGHGLVKGAQS